MPNLSCKHAINIREFTDQKTLVASRSKGTEDKYWDLKLAVPERAIVLGSSKTLFTKKPDNLLDSSLSYSVSTRYWVAWKEVVSVSATIIISSTAEQTANDSRSIPPRQSTIIKS